MHTRLGKVADWRDDRGYGFVVPVERGDGPDRLFFHIDDYRQAGRRPERGELVRYVASRQADGRWRAQAVTRTTPASPRVRADRRSPHASSSARGGDVGRVAIVVLLGVWLVLLWPTAGSNALPDWALPALLALNLLIYALYARDKRAARSGGWRTPESHLHLCELLGGWQAAWLAQRRLHHKRSKPAYLAVYWLMAVLHLASLVLWRAA